VSLARNAAENRALARAPHPPALNATHNPPSLNSNLIAKVVAAGAAFDDPKVSPVVRQTLLHWGYELSAADFEKYAKKVRAGAKTAFIRGSVVAQGGGGGGASSAAAAAEPLAGKKRGR